MDRCAVLQRVTPLLRSSGITVTNPIPGTWLSTVLLVFEYTHNFGKVPTMGFQSWFPKLAVPPLSSVNMLASPREHCDAAWINR